jgi:Flp pilus assembly pilin Flp
MALYYYLRIKNWLSREEGQDVVEYAVLVVFIGLVVIAGLTAFGTQMRAIYNSIAALIQGAVHT